MPPFGPPDGFESSAICSAVAGEGADGAGVTVVAVAAAAVGAELAAAGFAESAGFVGWVALFCTVSLGCGAVGASSAFGGSEAPDLFSQAAHASAATQLTISATRRERSL
jgi:hypothetical protein